MIIQEVGNTYVYQDILIFIPFNLPQLMANPKLKLKTLNFLKLTSNPCIPWSISGRNKFQLLMYIVVHAVGSIM